MVKYAHIVVLENPNSTNASIGKRYLTAIKQANPESEFETITVDWELATKLKPKLKSHTLLCVIGGDGTMNSVAQILLGDASLQADQRRLPVLPLWGGNANDLAHILNGRPSHEKCQQIIQAGKATPIYPLRCRIKTEGQKELVRFAICYASFGAVAHVAVQLNKPSLRKNPLYNLPVGKIFSETAITLKTLHEAPTFVVEHEGERKIVYDWIIGKGPRMAKLLHMPVELTDQMFYQSILERKSLSDVAVRIAGLAWGTLAPTNDTKPVTFTTTEPIWAQFDGEPLKLPTHTTVTVGLSQRPFYALSTVPKKQSSATLKA